ncbi:MAG: hypothetical protein LUF02_07150 [Erysipelotrichaceae bacterium]|nr:hypothetical protein [Erysipelotrichaceae bacterium]
MAEAQVVMLVIEALDVIDAGAEPEEEHLCLASMKRNMENNKYTLSIYPRA